MAVSATMIGCGFVSQLELLIADGVIDEVLGRLKSGKEANISLVRRGDQVMAAKVYKDRTTRSFKNNAEYKEGRKVRNSRTQRAMDSGGQFGRDAAEQAWKSAEADALYKLVGTGVRIPTPVMFYEGVLLMDLVVDADGRPAPRMIDVAIEREAAIGVYADLCAQMISMLCCDLIHGDLSPYNILASADGPTIIDFPQVVSAVHNSRAEYFFLRDFDNVVRFVSGFDPSLAVHTADGRAIWRAYTSRDLTPEFVPPPPPPPRPTRGPDRRSRPDDRGRSSQRQDGRGPQRQDGRGPQRYDGRGPQRSGGGPPRSGGGPPRPGGGSPRPDRGPPRHDGRGPQHAGPGPSGPPPQPPRGPLPHASQSLDPRGQRPRREWSARPLDPGPGAPGPGAPGARPRPDEASRSPARPRRDPPPASVRWTESRPSSAPPPAARGRRRRPKRRS